MSRSFRAPSSNTPLLPKNPGRGGIIARAGVRASAAILVCAGVLAWAAMVAAQQQIPPDLLEEAARRSGLSREELQRRYQGAQPNQQADSTMAPPGRTSLPQGSGAGAGAAGASSGGATTPAAVTTPVVVLPLANEVGAQSAGQAASPGAAGGASAAAQPAAPGSLFGADFFRLDAGLFAPPAFGPVPESYLLGPGDQIAVDMWGDVEMRLERVVDRDGSIILPKGGKIICAGRTLGEVTREVKERLSRSYSGISTKSGQGTTFVDVTLGALRAIRVFVVGDAARPGAYQLNSVSTVFTALYAAGGPAESGSMRDIRLMRGSEAVASLDLYRYLLDGKREGDQLLREGDTVFIPPRGKTVQLSGAVRRPLRFELKEGEELGDLIRFGGGFLATAATERVHIERIVPPSQRKPMEPDLTTLDVPLDPAKGAPAEGDPAPLLDGDKVSVGAIAGRLENYVTIDGNVKRPGRYEYQKGLDVGGLVDQAGGLWQDTLVERALIERTKPDETHETVAIPLGDVLSGKVPNVQLQPRDALHIYSIWDVKERFEVAISGEVRNPGTFEYREGMTLSDLLLQAGGLKESADGLRAEVSRLRPEAIESRDTSTPPDSLVEVLQVPLGGDPLRGDQPFPLLPHDRVAVRKLPWWELQQQVTVHGEVQSPGVYSLQHPDERISSVIARAGGLKPTAFAPAARVVRAKDGLGNVAIDLVKALDKPGKQADIILTAGDEVIVPQVEYTVKVVGAVGFPTSLAFQRSLSLGDYVDMAGGYADGADKWKTRVVYPNGLSRPIKKIWRDPQVMAGSTIVVPAKSQQEGKKLETVRDIAAILASFATVYLVIDRTAQ